MSKNSGKHTKPENQQPLIPVFERGFTMVPRFWLFDLMKRGPGIPPTFWKFMLVLWSEIMGHKPTDQRKYTAEFTMRDFPVDKDTANKWVGALIVSGLFIVELGKRFAPNLPGTPSYYIYRDGAGEHDWKAFIEALHDTCQQMSHRNQKQTREGILSFQICLALKVDKQRAVYDLPAVNEQFNDRVAAGQAKREADGTVTWQVVDSPRHNLKTAEHREYVKGLEEFIHGPEDDD
jgi:hypothetical protein